MSIYDDPSHACWARVHQETSHFVFCREVVLFRSSGMYTEPSESPLLRGLFSFLLKVPLLKSYTVKPIWDWRAQYVYWNYLRVLLKTFSPYPASLMTPALPTQGHYTWMTASAKGISRPLSTLPQLRKEVGLFKQLIANGLIWTLWIVWIRGVHCSHQDTPMAARLAGSEGVQPSQSTRQKYQESQKMLQKHAK